MWVICYVKRMHGPCHVSGLSWPCKTRLHRSCHVSDLSWQCKTRLHGHVMSDLLSFFVVVICWYRLCCLFTVEGQASTDKQKPWDRWDWATCILRADRFIVSTARVNSFWYTRNTETSRRRAKKCQEHANFKNKSQETSRTFKLQEQQSRNVKNTQTSCNEIIVQLHCFRRTLSSVAPCSEFMNCRLMNIVQHIPTYFTPIFHHWNTTFTKTGSFTNVWYITVFIYR